MRRQASAQELRRAFRVPSAGIGASCRGSSFQAHYQVSNLSTSGALLSAGYVPPVGEHIRVTLLPPNQEPIQVRGHIVRHHLELETVPQRHFPDASLAVQFDELGPDDADAIHDAVVDIILRDWVPDSGPH